MTTNDKLTACLDMIVALVDSDPRFAGVSARDALCTVHDYATMSTDKRNYSDAYFQAMETIINVIEGPTTSLDMHTLAIRVDDLLAFIDTEGDYFND